MVSGMTAIAGVATLGLSSMPLLADFGIIVAINISVALLSALVVLPPILVWADQRNWVSRGLIKTPPAQYATQSVEERYPAHVGAGSGANGGGPVDGDRPAAPTAPVPPPPPPSRQTQPQPVSPGVHVRPVPVPAALWLPQSGDNGST